MSSNAGGSNDQQSKTPKWFINNIQFNYQKGFINFPNAPQNARDPPINFQKFINKPDFKNKSARSLTPDNMSFTSTWMKKESDEAEGNVFFDF